MGLNDAGAMSTRVGGLVLEGGSVGVVRSPRECAW